MVTVQSPEHARNEEVAWRKNDRYFEAVLRHGGQITVLDEVSGAEERAAAFAEMDGLLLSGGADIDPRLYGEEPDPSVVVEPGRDALEHEAFAAAEARSVPIFGVCRGLQAINVFRGGSLVQDLRGHTSPAYPAPEARSHELRLDPDSRLAAILGDAVPLTEATVNTYHHQGVTADRLGAGLVATGFSSHDHGELVEAFEDPDPDRWVVAVQSHPERTEFTSPEFARLWVAFLDAARGHAGG